MIHPDEVYHLAAQSHVRVSFDEPEYTGETTGLGTVRLLEAIRQIGLDCRFYHASSGEMFGSSPPPQNELTPFRPCSPYGTAKLFAHWTARNYREAYGIFVVNGILFNHESPRRGETFVTRKITRAVARIHAGVDNRSGSAISTPYGTGDTRPNTSRACGGCCRSISPKITYWPPGSGSSVQQFLTIGLRAGRPGLAAIRSIRRSLPAASGSRRPHRRRIQGEARVGWKPQVQIPELIKIMAKADIRALEDRGRAETDRPDLPGWQAPR